MTRKNNKFKKSKMKPETRYKCKKLAYIYVGITIVAIILSLVCHFGLQWNTISDFLLCFVGVSGTVASLYSIYVTVTDEIRSKKESEENKQFLDNLSAKLEFISSNTETIISNFDDFLTSHLESNIISNKDDDKPQKGMELPDDSWKKPNDENPTT